MNIGDKRRFDTQIARLEIVKKTKGNLDKQTLSLGTTLVQYEPNRRKKVGYSEHLNIEFLYVNLCIKGKDLSKDNSVIRNCQFPQTARFNYHYVTL